MALGAVDAPQTPARRILEDALPDQFGFTHTHCIAVLRRLLGVEVDVRPAEDDRLAAPAELGREVVCAVGIQRPGADRDQIGRRVKIDALDHFVDQGDVPAFGRQRSEIGQSHGHHLSAAYPDRRPVRFRPIVGGLNDKESVGHDNPATVFDAGRAKYASAEKFDQTKARPWAD
jgi:hypothetical protein